MSTTLTVRGLPKDVKRKLRLKAALNNRSMEAEARAILTTAMNQPAATAPDPRTKVERQLEAINRLKGIWRHRGTTDQHLASTRGDPFDDAYSGR
jgi:antitoxin FitA